MLRNYFKIAFRNLAKSKTYSFVTIFGLGVGLAAGMLLMLWVQDELSFNGFHRNADRLHIAAANFKVDGKTQTWQQSPAPLASFAKRQVPEVADAVRINRVWEARLFRYRDKVSNEKDGIYTDPGFFTAFDFPLLRGNPKNPFPNNRSIVLTETVAKKYFGGADPLGKLLQLNDKDSYTVSGVAADMPANTSSGLKARWFLPFAMLNEQYKGGEKDYPNGIESDWGNYNYTTWFLLKSGVSAEKVAQKLTQIHRKNQPGEFSKTLTYTFLPMPKYHLYNADGTGAGISTVRIFAIVAVVILLIACINYVNLVTARATKRAKEVGIRKMVGGSLGQLFGQFLGESVLTFGLALGLALLLIGLLLPVYNSIAQKEMGSDFLNPTILGTVGATMLVTLLVAGVYPALLLSSFQPLQALKGRIATGGSNAAFRRGLVVVQFAASITLIVSTLVIGGQMRFVREKELGYDKANVLVFGMGGEMGKHTDAIRSELLKQPGVAGVGFSSQNIVWLGSSSGDTDWEGKEPGRQFMVNQLSGDKQLFDLLGMQLVEGQGFYGTKADSGRYVLNQTAIARMGIKDPVGKSFTFHERKGVIAGVVKDFHFASLHKPIEPVILFYSPGWWGTVYVKTTGRDAAKAIAAASRVWKTHNPNSEFDYSFLDDNYASLYEADQRTGTLFNYFAGIAIFISCLGLFGLVTYTAETKVKEIGIRKVLGASVSQIASLLSVDLLKLVLVAFVIATPVAWYVMNKWLQDFAYRIDIQWWVFALAGFASVAIALVTVSFQAIKAALANPVKSLRSE